MAAENTRRDTTIRELTETSSTSQMPRPGEVLGHCRIIELIAAGGMANVYKVWHEQLEVNRALKILKPGFSDEARGRLETEAKISANLRHPNIVEIYGLGFWNAVPYIEMELIDGPSLKDLLEQNQRLPVPFALAVTHFVCQALQFAYNQDMTLYGKIYDGLVHRDIKPANIIISSKGQVKLADFGIARPSEVSLHTVGSKVMGTFAYLSPEQLNGEKLDHRSDIYALGAVLYEMVTGSKTFPQRMLTELIQKKTRGQYIPIESAGIELPRNLCAAVDKSLELEREQRFADTIEFDGELIAVLKKMSLQSPAEIIQIFIKNPHPGPEKQANPQKLQKKPVALISAVALTLLLAGIAAIKFTNYYKTDRNRQSGSVARAAAPVDSTMVQQVMEKSMAQHSGREPSKNSPPTSPPRSESFQAQAPYEKALKAIESGNYQSAADFFAETGYGILNDREKEIFAVHCLDAFLKTGQLQAARAHAEQFSVDDGYYYALQGDLNFRLGELESASRAFEKALSTPSSFGRDFRSRALYLTAKVFDAQHAKRPNRGNRLAGLQGWDNFLKSSCSGNAPNSELCLEAEERIKALSD